MCHFRVFIKVKIEKNVIVEMFDKTNKQTNNKHNLKWYWFWNFNGSCWTSIGGLLKPIHPNGIFPNTQYRKPFLMVLMV